MEYDIVITNNAGSKIKILEEYAYVETNDTYNFEQLKERLVQDAAYQGLGTYDIYEHVHDTQIGDEIPSDLKPVYTVVFEIFDGNTLGTSCAMASAIADDTEWVPVARAGQQITLKMPAGDVVVKLGEAALSTNLETWKGGYLNVNHGHDDTAFVDGVEIEDAKYEDGMLYHRFNAEAVKIIRGPTTSGRSIEIAPLELVDGEITSYRGLGLSVLYPPVTPSCTADMGCSSNSIGDKIKAVANRISHSFKPNEASGNMKPDMEHINMEPEIEKLKLEVGLATASRDAALTEVETLKASLNVAVASKTELETTITEQIEQLTAYKDAEIATAAKALDTQWEAVKATLPPGKVHTAEASAALEKQFKESPHEFIGIAMAMKLEGATAEAGAQYTQSETDTATLAKLGIPSIDFK